MFIPSIQSTYRKVKMLTGTSFPLAGLLLIYYAVWLYHILHELKFRLPGYRDHSFFSCHPGVWRTLKMMQHSNLWSPINKTYFIFSICQFWKISNKIMVIKNYIEIKSSLKPWPKTSPEHYAGSGTPLFRSSCKKPFSGKRDGSSEI